MKKSNKKLKTNVKKSQNNKYKRQMFQKQLNWWKMWQIRKKNIKNWQTSGKETKTYEKKLK